MIVTDLFDCAQLQVPVRVPNLTFKVAAVAAGMGHTLCLSDIGEVWACGWNNSGQLGLGDTEDRNSLQRVEIEQRVCHCSCGAGHSVVVTTDGGVYSWGNGSTGQLGVGDWTDRHAPTEVLLAGEVALAECGEEFTIVVGRHHEVWGCGLNNAGQLGVHTAEQAVCSLVRVGAKELDRAVVEQIKCSQSQVLAVCADLKVFTWGLPADRPNTMLQQAYPRTPEKMPLSKRVVRLECGRRHFCVVTPACYAPNCVTLGEGSRLCTVGLRGRFDIVAHTFEDEPLRRGGDVFTVMLFHQDGECLVKEAQVDDHFDGVHQVTYKVRQAGEYSMWVQQGGCHIRGSPFTLQARTARLSLAHSRVQLEQHSILAGQDAEVTLVLCDVHSNTLTEVSETSGWDCVVVPQSGEYIPCSAVHAQRGQWRVRLEVSGDYRVLCSKGGGQVEAVLVVEPGETSRSEIKGEGAGGSTLEAMTPTSFTIETWDRYGNSTCEDLDVLDIEIRGPTTITPAVGCFGVSGHEIAYTARFCGSYTVRVWLHKLIHTGHVTVQPGPADGMLSTVSGDLTGGAVGPEGTVLRCTVQVCDAGGNQRIGGGDAVLCEMSCTNPTANGLNLSDQQLRDDGGGDYSLQVTVPRGIHGLHMLKVLVKTPSGLEQVCGSPFVVVFETNHELERQREQQEEQERQRTEERRRAIQVEEARRQEAVEEKARAVREAEAARRAKKEKQERLQRERLEQQHRKVMMDKLLMAERTRRRALEALRIQQQLDEAQKAAAQRRKSVKRCGGGFVVEFARRPSTAGAAREEQAPPTLTPLRAFE
eukprot:TRINITY_DN751_c0_g1_i8.p1 TRINITY_DN751_c0_g1~~TRINITY_DN751_c0_g1_i8.p1  ORF type:complete len:812 (+),score=168.85 TRINITY_DN751_c0_g1_i8:375-2810(+)